MLVTSLFVTLMLVTFFGGENKFVGAIFLLADEIHIACQDPNLTTVRDWR